MHAHTVGAHVLAGVCGLQHRAFVALASGQSAQAADLFREGLKLEPTNMACATNMALAELYNRQLPKAVEALESVRKCPSLHYAVLFAPSACLWCWPTSEIALPCLSNRASSFPSVAILVQPSVCRCAHLDAGGNGIR